MIFRNLGFLLHEVGCSASAARYARTQGAGACKGPGPRERRLGAIAGRREGWPGGNRLPPPPSRWPVLPPWTARSCRCPRWADGPEPDELPFVPRIGAGAASPFSLPGPGAPVPLIAPCRASQVNRPAARGAPVGGPRNVHKSPCFGDNEGSPEHRGGVPRTPFGA